MSAALELIRAVEANGGQLRVDGGYLVIAPRGAAEPVMEGLREYKAEIIGLLESAPMPAPLPPAPLHDPAEWREPLARWLESDCIAHWRLHGGVGRLHIGFAEWEVQQGEVPCSRSVFESLLREQGWEIHPTLALVSGLMLRKDVEADESILKLLSRELPNTLKA